MKLSRRALRMQRHYARMHKSGGLNLVSLMDIFTILVFFLMVNSSDVKVLQQDKSVQLPVSVADQLPKDNLVITVAGNSILVLGRAIATLDDLGQEEVIAGLKTELNYQTERRSSRVPEEDFKGYPVTLVADKGTPYSLLKRIMATCADAQYTQISLAVEQNLKGKEL